MFWKDNEKINKRNRRFKSVIKIDASSKHLRHEYSRVIGAPLFLTWTPIIASIGTSVRGIETACGGK